MLFKKCRTLATACLSRNDAEEPHAKAAKAAKGRGRQWFFTSILNPYSVRCFGTQEFSFLCVLGGLGVRPVSLGLNCCGLGMPACGGMLTTPAQAARGRPGQVRSQAAERPPATKGVIFSIGTSLSNCNTRARV